MKYLILLLLTPILITAQDEERVCKDIYENIVNAIGNNSPYPPRFIFDKKDNGRIAYIRNNKIHFEKATYEALAELGDKQDDGVAFILAHELAHHYLNHSWLKQAGYAYSSTDIGDLLKEEGKSVDQRKIQETQADFYASFYAHIAGYNSLPIAESVLDIIYTTNHIDTNLVGYPSLHERKMIVEERAEEHENLTIIFDAAKIALLTSNYTEAISCYEFILNEKFTSREIFNNMGLAQLNQAIDVLGKEVFKYYIPTKLDSKMRGKSDDNVVSAEERKNVALELLESSLYSFNTSLNLDNEYINARDNKISVLVLLSYIDDSYESEMFNSLNTKDIEESEKNNFLGIYYSLKGDNRKSKKFFKKSSKQGNALSKLNIEKLKEKESNDNYEGIVIINDVDLEDVVFRGNYYKFRKIPGVKLKIMKLNDSVIYDYGRGKVVQVTDSNIFTSDPDISLNVSIDEVLKQYGNPNKIINTFNESFYVYNNIIFTFSLSTKQLKQLISFI